MCNAVKELYESGYNNGMKSGVQAGVQQGIEQEMGHGIRTLIEISNEQGLSADIICSKLMKYYDLSPEKAYEWISKKI